MIIIGLVMNVLLARLLLAALAMGWRLNRRLKALRDSHDGFDIAVRELNAAAARAEQGLADLRAATDEAIDELAEDAFRVVDIIALTHIDPLSGTDVGQGLVPQWYDTLTAWMKTNTPAGGIVVPVQKTP